MIDDFQLHQVSYQHTNDRLMPGPGNTTKHSSAVSLGVFGIVLIYFMCLNAYRVFHEYKRQCAEQKKNHSTQLTGLSA